MHVPEGGRDVGTPTFTGHPVYLFMQINKYIVPFFNFSKG